METGVVMSSVTGREEVEERGRTDKATVSAGSGAVETSHEIRSKQLFAKTKRAY